MSAYGDLFEGGSNLRHQGWSVSVSLGHPTATTNRNMLEKSKVYREELVA